MTPFKKFWHHNDQGSHQNLIKQEYPLNTPRKDKDEISKFSIITPISICRKLADFSPMMQTHFKNNPQISSIQEFSTTEQLQQNKS